MEKEFVCKECGNKYLLLKSLRRHVLQCHEDKLYLISSRKELKTFKFECDQCDKGYNQLKHLTFHKRKVHGHEVYTRKLKTKCPFCEEHFLRNDIQEHLQNMHELSIEKINLQFESYEFFLEWKLHEEEVTKSKFIKKNGTYKSVSSKKQAVCFHCHRSGYYIPTGKGIRHLKTQGSNKINGFCPAEIKVSVSDCGEVKVTYIKTHIGHQNDLEHLIVKSKNRRKKSKITSPERILKNEDSKNTDSYCNSIKSNMCTHVQVIDQLKKGDETLELSSSDNECIDNGDTNLSTDFSTDAGRIEESNIFVKEVSREVSTSDLLKRKENLKTQFANLVNEASEEEEIKYLEDLIKSAKLTINAIKNRNCSHEESILKFKKVPAKNKNIIPQTLFILQNPTTFEVIEKVN